MTEAQDTRERVDKRWWNMGLCLALTWSILVGVVGYVCLQILELFYFGPATSSPFRQGIFWVFALALAPWVIVLYERWYRSAREESPDLSPMPEEFADFERMLEEAKEKSGTLICLECGHDNPVGQTNCEACGAWVPQTAKARWAYGGRTEES